MLVPNEVSQDEILRDPAWKAGEFGISSFSHTHPLGSLKNFSLSLYRRSDDDFDGMHLFNIAGTEIAHACHKGAYKILRAVVGSGWAE